MISPKHDLLSKVLRSHADRRICSGRRGKTAQCQKCDYAGESFRSSHPSPPSASQRDQRCRYCPCQYLRRCPLKPHPGKMNTPRPPPPMAAAMVAVPMVVTVATRIPARMVRARQRQLDLPAAVGRRSFPWRLRNRTRPDPPPGFPTNVFRKIGSSPYNTRRHDHRALFPIPPMNGIGMRNPNRARLGIVCTNAG